MKAYEEFCQLIDKSDSEAQLSPAEARRLEELATMSPRAAQEMSVHRALTQLDVKPSNRSDASLVEGALASLWEEEKVVVLHQGEQRSLSSPDSERVLWSKVSFRLVVAAAAVSALGFGGWAFRNGMSEQEPQLSQAPASYGAPAVLPVAEVSRAEFTLTSGEVFVNGESHRVGQRTLDNRSEIAVKDGPACLALERSIDLCMTGGSRLKLENPESWERTVTLLSGKLLVSSELPTNAVDIFLSGIHVSATAAVFSIEALSESEATVTTLEGIVEVKVGATRSHVAAGQRLLLKPSAQATAQTITRGDEARDRALLAPLSLWKPETITVVSVESDPPGALLTIAGIEVGRTPVSLLMRSGSAELRLDQQGYEPLIEGTTLRFGQELRLSYRLEAEKVAKNVAVQAEPPPPILDLLAEARAHMGAGRFQAAEHSYGRLQRLYPRSPESRTVLLTLGHLRLDRLGKPGAALAVFESYLASSGPLSQEALLGKIRALRQLGRRDEEQKAIEQYLKSYTRSAQSSALRGRLSELQ